MALAIGSLSEGVPLYRRDLLVMSPVTSRQNLALMPPGKKGQVRVLAADDTGCLISFQMAKWVPAVSWRYSVADSSRIEAVCIGDVDAKGKYTVWYAVGTTVRSLDKLGKEAAAFSTNSTETVRLLCVGGGYAWTAGEYVVNLFDTTGKDLGYVMCPDRVQALATGAFIREGGVDAVVGCADRVIRVVSGSRVMSEVGVEGPVTALCVQPHPGSATGPAPSSAGPLVWYGTANGAVGVLAFVRGTLVPVWSFVGAPTGAAAAPAARCAPGASVAGVMAHDGSGATESAGHGSSAGVTSICLGDLITTANLAAASNAAALVAAAGSATGAAPAAAAAAGAAAFAVPNVCVARDDGSVEVYTAEMAAGSLALPAAPATAASAAASSTLGRLPDIHAGAGAAAAISMPLPGPLRLAQCVRLEESVRRITVGPLDAPGFQEMVAQTFSGRIVCITPDGMLDRDKGDGYGRTRSVTAKEAQISAVMKEMEELRKRIAKEREKIASGAVRLPTGGGASAAAAALAGTPTAVGVAALPDGTLPMSKHDVISHFTLDPTDASYVLSLEIPATIETVVLQCSVPCDIIDGADGTDPTQAAAATATSSSTASSVGAMHLPTAAGAGDGGASAAATPSLTFSTTGLAATLAASIAAAFSPHRSSLGLSAALTSAAAADSGVSASVLLSASAKATAAIISRTPCDPRSGVATLVTFRCQESSTRVVIRMRTIEGQHGDMAALVINKHPPKSATLVRLPVKPLSLHHRLLEPASTIEAALSKAWAEYTAAFAAASASHSAALASGGADAAALPTPPPPPPPTFPFGVLTITGTFTLSQMHEWMAACLPDVPLRLTSEGREEVTLAFRNVFVGSHLLCTYRKGVAAFKSDSPSALAIIKEVVTTNATALKIRVSTTMDVPRYALRHIMNLLGPKLAYLLSLQAKADLVEAVREMATTDVSSDKGFLHPELADILSNADRYQRQLKMRQKVLDYTTGIVTDAFVDAHRFQGHDVASRIADLVTLLQQFHSAPETVLAFMESGGAVAGSGAGAGGARGM